MISSLESNDVAPTIGIPGASRRRGEARPSCVACQAEIVDDHWFCRVPESGNGESNPENRKALLCSPRCALRHFATLYPHDNGFDSDYEQHQNTFHFL
jgi:hypothetical protein